MGTYKITNITNLVGKRDGKFNSALDVEYVDNMQKKKISVKPGDSVYLTVQILPLSVHRLRVKNLITIDEVSDAELAILHKAAKPAPAKKAVSAEADEDSKTEEAQKHGRKKTVKKEN